MKASKSFLVLLYRMTEFFFGVSKKQLEVTGSWISCVAKILVFFEWFWMSFCDAFYSFDPKLENCLQIM